MSAILLDTTVLIDLLRGRPGAAGRLAELHDRGDLPCVCAINVEEIVRGLRPSEEEAASNLIEGLAEIPLGREEGERAGRWRRHYARSGKNLAQANCLIAAAAASAAARIVTGNPKDFPMTDELEIEHWPVGR